MFSDIPVLCDAYVSTAAEISYRTTLIRLIPADGKTFRNVNIYSRKRHTRVMMSFWYFFYSLSNIMVMFLMMTMNAWVNVCVALGLTVGFTFSEIYASKKKIKVIEKSSRGVISLDRLRIPLSP